MGYFFSLSKSATSIWLDVSEWILLVFGIVLVIGLVIEYRSEHGSRLMKLGEVLVIVGVLGELLGDGGIFGFSRHLQTISDAEIAVLEDRASKNEAEAARFRELASNADLARMKLEASLEWRKLTSEQEHKLCVELGPRLARKYHINALADDMEVESYATAIADALDNCEKSGGLTPSINPPHLGYVARWKPHERPLFGVWITYDPSASAPKHPSPSGFGVIRGKTEAEVVRNKLEASGITVAGITSDPEGVLPLGIIYVGPRLPPNALYLKSPAPARIGMIP